MQKQSYFNSLILLLTSAIWGFSFVAQRNGMEYLGPFTFNGVRFALGAASLLPLYYYLKRKKEVSEINISDKVLKKGMFLGIVLFIAASLQQIGMIYTTAGNGGFITSLYVVLVPFFLLLQKNKISRNVWIGAFIAVIGLYLLSVQGNLSINTGDSLVLISAVFWAIHVILTGRYASSVDIVLLAIIQFTATALFSLIVAFIIEDIFIHTVLDAAIPIIYGGVFSVGIAYTLQIIAQKKSCRRTSRNYSKFRVCLCFAGRMVITERKT
jgi:drug/metabolite transporter (DMT)-like permease